MGTRSFIAQEMPNGTYRSIYCHFDGYPSGVGAVLKRHYQDAAKVDALIALGDLSAIAEEIGEAHAFDAGHTEHPDWCLAYGRDRGEDADDIAAQTHAGSTELLRAANGSCAEFLYVYLPDGALPESGGGRWRAYQVYSADSSRLISLAEFPGPDDEAAPEA
jgi:hypothetical protein